MPSRLHLIATLTVLPVAFGAVWLASVAVLAMNIAAATLTAPSIAYPAQQIPLSGDNYWQCRSDPNPGASDGVAPDPTDSYYSADPGSPDPGGWVGVQLDNKILGAHVQPDASGSISLSITLPPDIAPGMHTVTARCETADGTPASPILASAPIQVPEPPSLALSRTRVWPGEKVTVTGQGFGQCSFMPSGHKPVEVPVRLLWDDKPLALAQGVQFSTEVTVPATPPGPYTVGAECYPQRTGVPAGILARASLGVISAPPGGGPPGGGISGGGGPSGAGGSWPGDGGSITHVMGNPPGNGVVSQAVQSSRHTVSPPPTQAPKLSLPPPKLPSRLPLKLIAWAAGGSLVGLVTLLLAFGTPLTCGFRRWYSTGKSRAAAWWLLLAGKPRVAFAGHDRSRPSVQLSHGHGEVSFTIGIQVRPDARGYEGHVEVTP
jgi:hypothetical protein